MLDKETRIDVFKKTLKETNRVERGEVFHGILPNYKPSQRYYDASDEEGGCSDHHSIDTVYRVNNVDCLVCASSFGTGRVCVLNMASEFQPGGGVRNGSRAQEEVLCCRSGLYNTLPLKTQKQYSSGLPYMQPDQAVYSTNVPVIKDANYKLLENSFNVDFISCAAVRKPVLNKNKDDYESKKDKNLMLNKIRLVIQLADYKKVDHLVLGAFGCGAFGNPPEAVAQLFKIVLEEYSHSFASVSFAILERNETRLNSAFSKVFSKEDDVIEVKSKYIPGDVVLTKSQLKNQRRKVKREQMKAL